MSDTQVSVVDKIKKIVIDIKPEDVMKDAWAAGLDVHQVEDFRKEAVNYWRIEDVMDQYAGLAARYSAISGATSGVGGVATAVTLGGIDIAHMAAQLYRLGQRLSILNGFDPNNAIQKEKNLEIYLYALGFDSLAQAAIKNQLLEAASIAGKKGANSNPVLSLIMLISEKLGKKVISKEAAKYLPIVGGIAGATVNYYFAKSAANMMVESYKKEYFRTWQAAQR
ncbi:conserved hypothetical protein [Vibrio harveyi]|uniref:EcsC family protein n=1 Tax=Vibrio harveyi TaxID=669 RepID=UPI001EFD6540|nr:EcsC family protein [Vibrio harveyi]MCG9235106.1 EcsC family protein [Vibrio harveyi]MCG9586981.1 EcsC family protein [Vibrio harveyi]MCG9610374.1 EcsC family protein [Vibrio harveyi]MCG9667974.1 EcsC family protein [Vibrio harveyi]CAH1196053.1 conserved hypothetical protein [Vibrio harveyi]